MSTSSGAQPQVAGERVSTDTAEQAEGASAAASTNAAAPAVEPQTEPAQGPASPGATRPAPHRPVRRVRLSMARVDPWSVMKVAFLLSVAAGIAMVIATSVLWMVLSGLNVFSDLDRIIRDIQPVTAEPFSVMNYIGFARVVSLAVVIAVIDVILLTALATLGAYLYNICSSLVGGVRMTLTDD